MIFRISIKDSRTKQRAEVNCYMFTSGTVSFIDLEIMKQIEQLDVKGICMNRFKGDIVTTGSDFMKLNTGEHFYIGDTEFIVRQVGKPCHQKECRIFSEDKLCLLQNGVMFAEVERSGLVNVGDEMEWIS